jgi:Protein of unknown function (DUF2602).
LEHMDSILQTYCEGCFLYQYFKQEMGKRQAYQFCIQSCTVGQSLQKIGQRLLDLKDESR